MVSSLGSIFLYPTRKTIGVFKIIGLAGSLFFKKKSQQVIVNQLTNALGLEIANRVYQDYFVDQIRVMHCKIGCNRPAE